MRADRLSPNGIMQKQPNDGLFEDSKNFNSLASAQVNYIGNVRCTDWYSLALLGNGKKSAGAIADIISEMCGLYVMGLNIREMKTAQRTAMNTMLKQNQCVTYCTSERLSAVNIPNAVFTDVDMEMVHESILIAEIPNQEEDYRKSDTIERLMFERSPVTIVYGYHFNWTIRNYLEWTQQFGHHVIVFQDVPSPSTPTFRIEEPSGLLHYIYGDTELLKNQIAESLDRMFS